MNKATAQQNDTNLDLWELPFDRASLDSIDTRQQQDIETGFWCGPGFSDCWISSTIGELTHAYRELTIFFEFAFI